MLFLTFLLAEGIKKTAQEGGFFDVKLKF